MVIPFSALHQSLLNDAAVTNKLVSYLYIVIADFCKSFQYFDIF